MQQAAFAYAVPWSQDLRKVLVTRGAQFEAMLRQLQAEKVRIFDHETSGLAWYQNAQSCGLALGVFAEGGIRSWYIPYRHDTGEAQLDIELLRPAIRALFAEPDVTWIGHHLKFDEHFNRKEGWPILGTRYCTQMAARLYDENLPIALKKRAQTDLGLHWAADWEHRLDAEIARLAKAAGVPKKQFLKLHGYSKVPIDLCGYYACFDVDFTGQLFQLYERAGIRTHYSRVWQTEMALIEALCDMEEWGTPIDVGYLQALRDTLTTHTQRLWGELERMLQWAMFNIGSDQELRSFLYERLRVPVTRWTKKEQPSVEGDVIAENAQIHPALPLILEWREAEKIRTTWTDSILDRLDTNNTLHGQLQNDGTNTGRLSSSDPNLQNFASDDDERAQKYSGRKLEDGGVDPWSVRRAFVCRQVEGRRMVRLYFDYSQIELRVMAYYTRDPIMVETYMQGGDIHARTQREIGSLLGGEPIPRRPAKVINFGLCMLGSLRVLTKQSGYVRLDCVEPWHLLWDGVEWVGHGGLVCRGEQEVMRYDGIEATPDHEVFTQDGRRLPLCCVANLGLRIAVGESGGVPQRYNALTDGEDWAPRESARCGSCVQCLREQAASGLAPGARLPLSGGAFAIEVQGSSRGASGAALRLDETTLRARYARLVGKLQGAWHSCVVRIARAVHSLGVGEVAALGFSGLGSRPDRQRWPLLAGQPATGVAVCESEPPSAAWRRYLQERASFVGEESLRAPAGAAGVPRVHESIRPGISRSTARVYDLINAGPRRRFTVEGRVVSNSYCMSAAGLSRNAGISLADAERFLAAFFQRYHGVSTYRDVFWTQVRFQNCAFRNLFGRPRRVSGLTSDVGWQRRRAERQAFGTLIQGTAAELTKESIVRIHRWLRESGVDARLVSTIHDEVWLDCAPGCLTVVVPKVTALMEDYPEFAPIPVVVDGAYSDTNWAEKHKLPR